MNAYDEYDKYWNEVMASVKDDELISKRTAYMIGIGIFAKGLQVGTDKGIELARKWDQEDKEKDIE